MSEQDQYVIEANGVCKVYDSGRVTVEALRSVSLGVQRGEMVAVMGPSGCGKTTLLNCLSGLDDLTSGSVKINGPSFRTCPTGSRRNIGPSAWATYSRPLTCYPC